MFVPYQTQPDIGQFTDPTINHWTSNGTAWWIEVSDDDDRIIRVSSFKEGPIVAQFRTDLATLELAAITELMTAHQRNR